MLTCGTLILLTQVSSYVQVNKINEKKDFFRKACKIILNFQVTTLTGKTCQFPFTYGGNTYTTCTVNGPNNPTYLPQCITSSGSWDTCNGKPYKIKISFFKNLVRL